MSVILSNEQKKGTEKCLKNLLVVLELDKCITAEKADITKRFNKFVKDVMNDYDLVLANTNVSEPEEEEVKVKKSTKKATKKVVSKKKKNEDEDGSISAKKKIVLVEPKASKKKKKSA